eukprot:CAMPEP_0206135020 /NCGR_PEP_ID=MMETSP1473-20131121/395_1 /ASSEMBLY_ACC=CAM_ASM_001109 /TAXON_ID=1461547 /ORGANISM="Stichococcus sp, Strain RCC1054" /LENGTH=96 /DNA_ID=CAMNT_0053526713 /DNA_START=106 /DNA_END=397 /DNA_ORIENTATION=+
MYSRTNQGCGGPMPAPGGLADYNLIGHIRRELSAPPPQQRPDLLSSPAVARPSEPKPAEGLTRSPGGHWVRGITCKRKLLLPPTLTMQDLAPNAPI